MYVSVVRNVLLFDAHTSERSGCSPGSQSGQLLRIEYVHDKSWAEGRCHGALSIASCKNTLFVMQTFLRLELFVSF